MPYYDYVCANCGNEIEVMHSVHAEGPSACPKCGGPMKKTFAVPAVHFKGTGWARKEKSTSSRSSRAEPKEPVGSTESSSSSGSSSGSSSSDSSSGDGGSPEPAAAPAAEGANLAKAGQAAKVASNLERTSALASEGEEGIALVTRTGPKGINPAHHNANVTVRDANGNITLHTRIVSGNMTPEEQALRFPKNTLASHTEARAVRQIPLEKGQSMTITGQNPPCPSCKGAMNKTAAETGAQLRYQWREAGRTQSWKPTVQSGD